MHNDRSAPLFDEFLASTLISRDAFTHAASLAVSPAHSALCLERARDHARVADSLMVGTVRDSRLALLEAVLESRRAYRLAMSLAQQMFATPPLLQSH